MPPGCLLNSESRTEAGTGFDHRIGKNHIFSVRGLGGVCRDRGSVYGAGVALACPGHAKTVGRSKNDDLLMVLRSLLCGPRSFRVVRDLEDPGSGGPGPDNVVRGNHAKPKKVSEKSC